jgi:hypothetical protein
MAWGAASFSCCSGGTGEEERWVAVEVCGEKVTFAYIWLSYRVSLACSGRVAQWFPIPHYILMLNHLARVYFNDA